MDSFKPKTVKIFVMLALFSCVAILLGREAFILKERSDNLHNAMQGAYSPEKHERKQKDVETLRQSISLSTKLVAQLKARGDGMKEQMQVDRAHIAQMDKEASELCVKAEKLKAEIWNGNALLDSKW